MTSLQRYCDVAIQRRHIVAIETLNDVAKISRGLFHQNKFPVNL